MTPPSPTTTNFTDLLLQNLANLPTPADPPFPTDLPTTTLNLTPAKPTLLTLHALYPTTLLPALDLLDRRLITRLDLPPPPLSSSTLPPRSIYHVRSAAPSSRRPGRDPLEPTHSYEVRTSAWSCTCAAFAFAAFNQPYGGVSDGDLFGGGVEVMDGYGYAEGGGGGGDGGFAEGIAGEEGRAGDGKGWGGLMRGYQEGMGGGVPVCKHLLACAVAESWGCAARMVEVRVVGRGEMAGWGGGWGG